MNMYLYETEIVDKLGFSITFIGSDEQFWLDLIVAQERPLLQLWATWF